MNAKELNDRSTDDLQELKKATEKELFENRMKNHTNQLEDTSLLGKARRDIARIETVLSKRQVEQGSQA